MPSRYACSTASNHSASFSPAQVSPNNGLVDAASPRPADQPAASNNATIYRVRPTSTPVPHVPAAPLPSTHRLTSRRRRLPGYNCGTSINHSPTSALIPSSSYNSRANACSDVSQTHAFPLEIPTSQAYHCSRYAYSAASVLAHQQSQPPQHE